MNWPIALAIIVVIVFAITECTNEVRREKDRLKRRRKELEALSLRRRTK